MSISVLTLLLALFSFSASSQTRPVNDDLANATVLTGTDFTFTGSLAGATLEAVGREGAFYGDANAQSCCPQGSLWWSWTAPSTTFLNLEVTPFASGNGIDGVMIFRLSQAISSPQELFGTNIVGSLIFFAGSATPWFSVPVEGGSNYLFMLIGASTNSYTIRCRATNAPIILKQPLSQSVSPNGCTTFYVESASHSPRTYQWFFNGTNLPGEVTPILGLYHISAEMAGAYSVMVSNADGFVMSDAAILTVSQSTPPIFTSLRQQSNTLALTLAGEGGRAYRILSSTNLKDWSPENSFSVIPQINPDNIYPGSLVFITNSPLLLNATPDAPLKFYLAQTYEPPDRDAEVCINNLRQIAIAKQLWRTDYMEVSWRTPALSDILPFFSHPERLICPQDTSSNAYFSTSYTIVHLKLFPVCDINPAHVLEGLP